VLYRWTRDLHLYTGLFISPFLLVFAISVFFLNHAKVQTDAWTERRTVRDIQVPEGIERVRGRDAVDAAHAIARQAGIEGEVGFTRYVRETKHFVFPISRPGREGTVDLDAVSAEAVVSLRSTSLWESFAYLHKMPGPHNADIRGNWLPTRVWRQAADLTIYLTLFLTITGVYLWWALRAERRIGIILISTGLVSLVAFIHVLLH
jgi:hypothetical protein